MFFNYQTKDSKDEYEKFLKVVGSLSNLFSESNTPYLYYRVAEKLFCKAFNTEDLGRSDVSVDTKKENLGIGLKTFLAKNNKTLQKVTEFGSPDRELYDNLSLNKKVLKIAELRNERINFTHRVHDIEKSIYHCVLRSENNFNIFEESMNLIDIDKIKNIKKNTGSITFDDGVDEYSFLLSKNTLTKRFKTTSYLYQFEVNILENPLDFLISSISNDLSYQNKIAIETIYLPLYGRNNFVYENRGLNQWNAKGRKRDYDEVYIPIPTIIHKKYPNFFPNRETPFELKLPNGKSIKSKICQDGGKALMSYSNKELGNWILRDVLKLDEGKLLTYEKLQILGIDSVRIDKINGELYEINFAKNGSYDNFIND